jgi:hypothetical protein
MSCYQITQKSQTRFNYENLGIPKNWVENGTFENDAFPELENIRVAKNAITKIVEITEYVYLFFLKNGRRKERKEERITLDRTL